MRAGTSRPPEGPNGTPTNLVVQIQGHPGNRRFESFRRRAVHPPKLYVPTTSCIMSKVVVIDSEGARSRFGTSLGTILAADTEGS
jgi:hypothetical protein